MLWKYKILLILVSFSIGISSCNKWLKLEPRDGIVKDDFWKTKEQVQSAVTGIYASMLGSTTANERTLTEYLWLWGEGRADLVTPATAASSEDLELANVTIQQTNTITNWIAVYRTINYCNTVIAQAPGVIAADPTFTQAQLNAALSEALTIRALMYFYLVRSFREVPLKLDATLSDQDLRSIPKVGADTTLNQIIADLKQAEPGAVSTYGSTAFDKGRVTKYTVNALLADVYLWMGRYSECVAECDKIVNSGQFGLVSGNSSSTWFNSLYVNGNSPESIFEIQFDVTKNNAFYRFFTTGARRWVASNIVMDNVYTQDLQNPGLYDIRGDGGSVRANDQTIWKFVGANNTDLRAADQSFAHWFVYRYAEILLIKAEALNQLNRGAEALPLIYRVRTRARALAATDLNPSPTDKNGIDNFILQERAREFAFEGKRWYDVLRFARRKYSTDRNFLSTTIASAIPPARLQSVIARYTDSNTHYFPIYFYELQTNKLLVQNPSYK